MDLHQESTPFLSSLKQKTLSPQVSQVPTSNVSTNSPSTSDNQLSSISKAKPGIGLSSSSLSTPVSPMTLNSAKTTDLTSVASTNSIGISSSPSSTSNNQKAVESEAQPGISPFSPSPVDASSKKPTGPQSSSPVFNVVSQSPCVRCSQLSDLNRNILQKLSESKCKYDEEMKESRKKMEKEYELKLLEHRTNLETVKKEAEKKLDSLNLELRLQLVKSKEENISLQQENLKIIKNSVQVEKFNKLKESYEKKIHEHELEIRLKLQNKEVRPGIKIRDQESQTMEKVFQIKDLESPKISHNMELKELRDTLEKEYKQKLSQQRSDLENDTGLKLDQLRKELTETLKIAHSKEMKELEEQLKEEYEKKLLDQRDLEKKTKSKLDQLRKVLTKCLNISIDTEAQPEKEIDEDYEVMINNESFASQSNEKKETNNPTVPDCEPAQKKQKLSIPSIQSDAIDGPKESLPSIGRELFESNDKLGYTEIPDDHCAVRICSICRWSEKIHNFNYIKHLKSAHGEPLSKEEEIVNFENAIVPDSIYPSLINKITRSQISAQEIDKYKIPKNYCFALICRICRWIGTRYHKHWRNDHNSSRIKSSIYLEFETVIMENMKYLQLRDEQKSQCQMASDKQPQNDNSTPEKNSKEGAPKSILKSSNKSDSRGQRTGKKRSSQVPMKSRKSLRFQLN
ncbi:ankycorbin-like [Panonychus citri]|uniref:ankycorbin-like n=1 Tax=Panonychus citri TaxID=50023 RepID=UPI0023077261|nr:ankycorbin-like [Panonychus citri]